MRLQDWFIPSKHNEYRQHWLERTAMLLMSGLVLLSFMAANLHVLMWRYSDWLVGSILPAVVVDLTNQNRAAASLPSLNRNPLLDQAAQYKAEHMAKLEYFSHYSPDGTSPWYWFETVGYTFAHAGENLAIHFNDSRALVEAWMNSPTHRDNIVAPQYTEIGIGTARGRFEGFDTVYVVQLFGTPAARPIPPPVIMATPPVTKTAVPEAAEPELPLLAADSNLALSRTETEATVVSPEIYPTAEAVVLSETVTNIEAARPEPVRIGGDVVWQLPHLSTTSGLLPLTLLTTTEVGNGYSRPFAAIATQPRAWLQGVYLVLGTVITLLLLASLIVGYRQSQPVQVAHGVGLLLLMSVLFALQVWLSTARVVIADGVSPVEAARYN